MPGEGVSGESSRVKLRGGGRGVWNPSIEKHLLRLCGVEAAAAAEEVSYVVSL